MNEVFIKAFPNDDACSCQSKAASSDSLSKISVQNLSREDWQANSITIILILKSKIFSKMAVVRNYHLALAMYFKTCLMDVTLYEPSAFRSGM